MGVYMMKHLSGPPDNDASKKGVLILKLGYDYWCLC